MRATYVSRSTWLPILLVVGGVVGCSQEEETTTTAAPRIEERTIGLSPAQASVNASFLQGQLENMRVYHRVEEGTGKIVEPPKFRATLKLTNSSADQTARPITGELTYLDEAGTAIPLAEGRGETTFKFPYYQDRLDPGMATSVDVDVPFPVAALDKKRLGEVRLELAYIPTPFREESVTIPVGLVGGQ